MIHLSTLRWETDSAFLKRSTSTMWTTTCLLLTCRSTAENVSILWSGTSVTQTKLILPTARLNHNDIKHCLFAYCRMRYAVCIFLALSTCTAPMGSISSMEVNVDVLEQMDLMDISDQEALDVFLNSGSGAEEGALASPLPGALTVSKAQMTNDFLLKMELMSIT